MANWHTDKAIGYVYREDRDSPYASKSGRLYQHHYVMCEHIGRPLRDDECVHHKDRNRANNVLSNLQLMTKAEHVKLHAIEDRGYTVETRKCKADCCGKEFVCSVKSKQLFCGKDCYVADISSGKRRKFEIAKEDLEALVWAMPTLEVAKLYGVSDVAISKRCKLLGIEKPGRGYWAKVVAGVIASRVTEPKI